MVKRKCIGFMLAAAIVSSSIMTTTNQVSAYNGNLDVAQVVSRESDNSVEKNVKYDITTRVVDKNNNTEMANLETYVKEKKDRGSRVLEVIDYKLGQGGIDKEVVAYDIMLERVPVRENNTGEIVGYTEKIEKILIIDVKSQDHRDRESNVAYKIDTRVVHKNDSEIKELEAYVKDKAERGSIVRKILAPQTNEVVQYEIIGERLPVRDSNGNITGYTESMEKIILVDEQQEEKINLPQEGTTIRYMQEEINTNNYVKEQYNGYMDYLEKDSSKAFPSFEVVETTFREEGKLITRFTINKIREGQPVNDFYCAIEVERKAIKSNWDNKDGQWHYYDANGNLVKGLAMAKWNGVEEKYYFDEEGNMVSNKWVKVDGKWYFCQSGGAVARGWLNEGNVWYYLNNEGVMQTGWQKILYNGNYQWFFLEAHGAMAQGWKFIDNNWHYLNADGTMATSKLIDGKVTEDGKEIVVQYKVDAHGIWDGKTIYPGGIIK